MSKLPPIAASATRDAIKSLHRMAKTAHATTVHWSHGTDIDLQEASLEKLTGIIRDCAALEQLVNGDRPATGAEPGITPISLIQ